MSHWTLFSIKGPASKTWLDVSNEVVETIYGSGIRPPRTSKVDKLYKQNHNVKHGRTLHNNNWRNIN